MHIPVGPSTFQINFSGQLQLIPANVIQPVFESFFHLHGGLPLARNNAFCKEYRLPDTVNVLKESLGSWSMLMFNGRKAVGQKVRKHHLRPSTGGSTLHYKCEKCFEFLFLINQPLLSQFFYSRCFPRHVHSDKVPKLRNIMHGPHAFQDVGKPFPCASVCLPAHAACLWNRMDGWGCSYFWFCKNQLILICVWFSIHKGIIYY